MSTYQSLDVLIQDNPNLPIYGTLYQTYTNQKSQAPTIFYLHGGGLIFGDRKDLPHQYIDQLTTAGYNLFTVDYPLAPESKLPEILESIAVSIDWFLDHAVDTLDLKNNHYILMGRSAGAYLALYQSVHHQVPAKGAIAFYGYFNLNEAAFSVPSRHFLTYPKVTANQMIRLTSEQPIVEGSMNDRYPIYIGARQSGTWQDLFLAGKGDAKRYSIEKNDLKNLPATFITAASGDPDVPVRQSKLLHKAAPNSYLHIVDSDLHDFDRTEIDGIGMATYQELLTWLNTLFS